MYTPFIYELFLFRCTFGQDLSFMSFWRGCLSCMRSFSLRPPRKCTQINSWISSIPRRNWSGGFTFLVLFQSLPTLEVPRACYWFQDCSQQSCWAFKITGPVNFLNWNIWEVLRGGLKARSHCPAIQVNLWSKTLYNMFQAVALKTCYSEVVIGYVVLDFKWFRFVTQNK